jgi:hypothetical protein
MVLPSPAFALLAVGCFGCGTRDCSPKDGSSTRDAEGALLRNALTYTKRFHEGSIRAGVTCQYPLCLPQECHPCLHQQPEIAGPMRPEAVP